MGSRPFSLDYYDFALILAVIASAAKQSTAHHWIASLRSQ
jgi:hypothetical protein